MSCWTLFGDDHQKDGRSFKGKQISDTRRGKAIPSSVCVPDCSHGLSVWIRRLLSLSGLSKSLEWVNLIPSLSVSLLSLISYFGNILSPCCLCSLSSVFFIDPSLSNHRHLQPVSSHFTVGKPRWERPPSREPTPQPDDYSHPTKTSTHRDSTSSSSQATGGSQGTPKFWPYARP